MAKEDLQMNLDNRIAIKLPNGMKLVAEQNQDPNFDKEIYVGIESQDGVWVQDLAIVRNDYSIGSNEQVVWNPKEMEVCVYADKDSEDYTHIFHIGVIDGDL